MIDVTITITIVEVETNIFTVKASYTDACNKEYSASITGEFDPWDDIYIPVFEDLGRTVMCKALMHKESFDLIIEFPDLYDPYEGSFPGTTKVIHCKGMDFRS